jgi:hypothetical protein
MNASGRIVSFAALLAPILFAATFAGNVHAQSCVSDEDCQDGSWCNGIERCEGNPGHQLCMPSPRPMCSKKQACDETAKQCKSIKKAQLRADCPKGEAWSVADGKCIVAPR